MSSEPELDVTRGYADRVANWPDGVYRTNDNTGDQNEYVFFVLDGVAVRGQNQAGACVSEETLANFNRAEHIERKYYRYKNPDEAPKSFSRSRC